MGDRRVLVYRETLVNPSEPFIVAQGEGLHEHEPWYLSVRRSDGHPLPRERDLRWTRTGTLRRAAWKRWGFSPRTLRAVRDISPVLVHAHFGRDAVQVLPLVTRLGLPLVTTFHGHDATRTDRDLADGSRSDRLYLQRRSDLCRTGARFLAVSRFIADGLVERGFPPDRIEVHHIGVDVDAIWRAAAGVVREPRLVVFVGRLVAQKGVDDLIGAMTELGRVGDLVVIGDGSERESLEAAAPDACFLGSQGQHEVWRWMARASVVVVPSKTGVTGAREAFGLVAAEAQAAGTPVVATTNGGLPEAIAPSLRQLQVPEGDVHALADAVDRAAGVAEAALEARAWIAVERNLAHQNERLDAIYREVAP